MAEPQRDTRERLLDAAEGLFAENGFASVSIRDIAATADVNIAAVNYHFQSKDNLYHEVLRRVMKAKSDRYTRALQASSAASPDSLESAIGTFFRTHFEDTLKHQSGRNFLKLLVRELHDGNRLASIELESLVRPMWDELGRSLAQAEPRLTADQIAWAIGSIHGQLVHFTMRWHQFHKTPDTEGASQFIRSVFPALAADVDTYIDRAVAHITRFTLAGIRALVDTDSGRTAPEEATR